MARERKRSAQKPEPEHGSKPVLFDPSKLDKSVIALPLLNKIKAEGPGKEQQVIIDLNLTYSGGRDDARARVTGMIEEIAGKGRINVVKAKYVRQYLFAKLPGKAIRQLVRQDASADGAKAKSTPLPPSKRAIYRVWPDFEIKALTVKTVHTVKAEPARRSFCPYGTDIVWAVMDSGIDGAHPHFARHKNLEVSAPLMHRDYTDPPVSEAQGAKRAQTDVYGHGTHVAGILAGEQIAGEKVNGKTVGEKDADGKWWLRAVARQRDENGQVAVEAQKLAAISGMAPQCKLVSLRVLDGDGSGNASNLIAALAYIQEVNGHGRRLLIQGVNMSVGYDFDAEWFACGQSPLCIEVDRLVKSGVVVVVAAGNTGYGFSQSAAKGAVRGGLDLTINDPGNAELAITVGSTHRDMPHVYGVSYFSSKGPTGDGRIKPDLVAPGEKIVSCASGKLRSGMLDEMTESPPDVESVEYVENSGTSMAAPHVSGVIAAFLSVRKEFIGRPEHVKQIFMSTATDLKRDRYFQGHGLVDLMRAIQSI